MTTETKPLTDHVLKREPDLRLILHTYFIDRLYDQDELEDVVEWLIGLIEDIVKEDRLDN